LSGVVRVEVAGSKPAPPELGTGGAVAVVVVVVVVVVTPAPPSASAAGAVTANAAMVGRIRLCTRKSISFVGLRG
jgi:hypothetical protein